MGADKIFKESDRVESSLNLKTFHYENLPMQYTEFFSVVKNGNFQLKKFDIFSYFCSKHRLWVHVRTASPQIGIPLRTPVFLYKSGV